MKNLQNRSLKIAAAAAMVLLCSSNAIAGYDIKKKIGDVDTKLTLFGFSQLEMRGGDGSLGGTDNTAVSFHAQRIRLGWKYSAGKVRSKVFIDFNKKSVVNATDSVGLPDNIKDAFVAYAFDKAFIPKLGLIKMPHGMGFTIPGWNLDIVERGFDKKLVLERNMGLMLSGRDIGFGNYGKVNGFEMGHERPWKGFGYDIMIANPAGRSAVVINAAEGHGNSYSARGMFDWTELLHFEASYAMSESAGGDEHTSASGFDTEDYESIDIGLDSHFLDGGNVKVEYITGHNIKGEKDHDMQALTVMGQYAINEYVEPTFKYMQGSVQSTTAADADLSNLYIGVNLFLVPTNKKMNRSSKRKRNAHKVVLNYIHAAGDTDTWKASNGQGGYVDDAWVFQYQVGF